MNRILIPLFFACWLLWACQPQDPQNQQAPPQLSSTPTTESTSPIDHEPPRPGDWPTFMGDLNFSGLSDDQNLKPPLALRWKFKTGGPIHASPIVAKGTVYVGSTDHKFYALDAKGWQLKWSFKTDGPIRHGAAYWNNRVYFSSADNNVYALDAETGRLIWQFKSKTWMDSPPIVANGKVYVGAFTRLIYVIDAVTGKRDAQQRGRTRINGIEYICTQARLQPVTPVHQATLWRKHIPHTYSYPVIANGVVYIGARDGSIRALSVASQEVLWSYETKGFVDAAPAISGGMLYITSHDGYVYAFDSLSAGTLKTEPDSRPIGIVIEDEVAVYEDKNRASAVKLRLNDGVELPIVRREENWYEIELPNGENGWMDALGIGTFVETEGIQFNEANTSNLRTLNLVEGGEYPHWSPDGQLVAFLRRTDLSDQYWRASEIWIMDGQSMQSQRLCEGAFYNPNLSWSLDGNLIAFEVHEDNDRYVWMINRKTLRLTKLVRGDGPAWSPTANRLVFRRWEEGVDVIYRINSDRSGLTPIARIPLEGRITSFGYLDAPSWSPDGDAVAIGLDHQHYESGYSRIRVHKVDGTKIAEIPTQAQKVRHIAWSADNSQLAYVLSGSPRPATLIDKQLHVTALNAENRTHILNHTSPSWSPKGKMLVYMEREDCMGLQWKVWLLDFQTNQKRQLARTTLDLAFVEWLPDGDHVCLWHTSDYLRDDKYQPAQTKGWIVKANP